MSPTFVFDGDCAFCTLCARFVERHVPTAAHVVPWQFADLTALGLSSAACVEAVQWVGTDGRRESGPAAIAQLLRSSSRPWRVAGRLLGNRPVLSLAWPVYRWVARNRDRMPGGTAACAVPQPPR